MTRFFTILFAMALTTAMTSAQAPPKPTPHLTVDQQKDIFIAYQAAVIAQDALAKAQATFDAAVRAYGDATGEVVEADGYPKGTTFQVDLSKKPVDGVVAHVPPSPTPTTPNDKEKK